jgi:aspartyl-tRNA(Asn)/glutamyl-tRNA(Gln) amidotransferase subunit C
MAIDRAEVRRIAELARLEIPEDAIEHVAAQLSSVLEFASTLNALELEGCEPAVLAPRAARGRPDAPGERTLGVDAVISGAPEAEDGFFLVPPVVENLEP